MVLIKKSRHLPHFLKYRKNNSNESFLMSYKEDTVIQDILKTDVAVSLQCPTAGSHHRVPPQSPTLGSHLRVPLQGPTLGSNLSVIPQGPTLGSDPKATPSGPTLRSLLRVPPQGPIPGSWVPLFRYAVQTSREML